MTLHPHLNRHSNRLHKFHKKIIRDNRKTTNNTIPLLNDIHSDPSPQPTIHTTIKRQYSSVPPYTPTIGKLLKSRNKQNNDFDSICIIL